MPPAKGGRGRYCGERLPAPGSAAIDDAAASGQEHTAVWFASAPVPAAVVRCSCLDERV